MRPDGARALAARYHVEALDAGHTAPNRLHHELAVRDIREHLAMEMISVQDDRQLAVAHAGRPRLHQDRPSVGFFFITSSTTRSHAVVRSGSAGVAPLAAAEDDAFAGAGIDAAGTGAGAAAAARGAGGALIGADAAGRRGSARGPDDSKPSRLACGGAAAVGAR